MCAENSMITSSRPSLTLDGPNGDFVSHSSMKSGIFSKRISLTSRASLSARMSFVELIWSGTSRNETRRGEGGRGSNGDDDYDDSDDSDDNDEVRAHRRMHPVYTRRGLITDAEAVHGTVLVVVIAREPWKRSMSRAGGGNSSPRIIARGN